MMWFVMKNESPSNNVPCIIPPVCPVSPQDRLTVEAPKRHKVSVHVLSREMDSCEYLYFTCWFHGLHPDAQWVQSVGLTCALLCSPGPIVGEFPAQNDVNLAPAPSLPQVRDHVLFIKVSMFNNLVIL